MGHSTWNRRHPQEQPLETIDAELGLQFIRFDKGGNRFDFCVE